MCSSLHTPSMNHNPDYLQYKYTLNEEHIRHLGYTLYTNPNILCDLPYANPFLSRPQPNHDNVFTVVWKLARSFLKVF